MSFYLSVSRCVPVFLSVDMHTATFRWLCGSLVLVFLGGTSFVPALANAGVLSLEDEERAFYVDLFVATSSLNLGKIGGAAGGRLHTEESYSRYLHAVVNATDEEIPEGWMWPMSAYLVGLLTLVQHTLGVDPGTVGEIGVHHGLFFLALAHTAVKGELLFACDVFEQQSLNVDRSGKGDLDKFHANLRRYGVEPSSIWIHHGSSASLSRSALLAAGLPLFRLLSIDGGHSAETVLGDLRFAAETVVNGAVVVLDDFTHPYWLGVREGLYRFFFSGPTASGGNRSSGRRGRTLAPFLLACNKLYLTTKSHHQDLLAAVTRDPWVRSLGIRALGGSSPFGSTHIGGWLVATQNERDDRHYQERCGWNPVPPGGDGAQAAASLIAQYKAAIRL
eukprot:gnl/TRDRNA2_/TRDRNA2_206138_c0_seq1.p1 gnl/TRDRNA2_/TRDRNA2_206138_c0~~gnl/TRDRNA2_/TRDRNA2_206138_c0_seq1.p1  ORF type:complete len:391 (-),score=40.43 gnl/TRDRNA2_/TRDRNA2_206138_c0_seq1:555-1727(-)